MPLIKCCDCGKGRRVKRRVANARRCVECRDVEKQRRQLDWGRQFREESRRKKRCIWCGEKLSTRSIAFCDICLAYHAGYSAISMRKKRARSPDYRADERAKVKARMAGIRAQRRAQGLNNRGRPFRRESDVKRSISCRKRFDRQPTTVDG